MESLILQNRRMIETETQIRRFVPLQADSHGGSRQPGQQIRFAKTMKINHEVESPAADLAHQSADIANRVADRALRIATRSMDNTSSIAGHSSAIGAHR